ncbi:hypothetical protein OOZ15_11255 [Galbibacter sp. EGI 63066]|uniref:hypothetical protein n=1 Tax=Galbibacter sp. EGI 63066 TaxID=2993559 RepID=UPI0022497C6F|nr:hypothetical protein [Galbibacter sp. EGI 63066]MCX2680519.1 hypothetical protein [Galbibacter sp. EGI 63066]
MKKIIAIVVLLLGIAFQSYPQKKQTKSATETVVELTPKKWGFKEGKVAFLKYKGRDVMKINSESGYVVLKDFIFKDGIIEYDIEPILPTFALAVYFHRKDEKEQEIVYLRAPKIGNPYANEGIQYCPYLDGVNMWDMYPQYQAPSNAKQGQWNHVKLVISGKQMNVFVNNKLVLGIPELEGRETEGGIAFTGSSYISHLKIKPGETEGLSPSEGTDLTRHESNYIRNWSITQASELPTGTEPTTLLSIPKNETFTEKIDAERNGLVNLTRHFGNSDKRRLAWLKATIITKKPIKTNLQLGFSDEIWVYLNDKITYTDKNIFPQNMKKYPNGRISVQNGSTELNLKQGKNELLIGVANDFYGWGIITRLENTKGVEEITAYKAPPKIAIENIKQYIGTYATSDKSSKLIFTQSNGDLTVQMSGQPPILLSHLGNNLFEVGLGIELQFDSQTKHVILKENGFDLEYTKEQEK